MICTGRQCSHASHLHNRISHWQFQTGSDRILPILMARQRGMQTGLIAVWWLAVSQSQHIIHRCPQVGQSHRPARAGLSRCLHKAIIRVNTGGLQLISFERFINLHILLLSNWSWMICHGNLTKITAEMFSREAMLRWSPKFVHLQSWALVKCGAGKSARNSIRPQSVLRY